MANEEGSTGNPDIQEYEMQIPCRLSRVSPVPVTVHYQTRNGSATAGVNYIAASGNLTWEPGQLDKHIVITTLEGTGPGTFYIDLASPINSRLAKVTSVITLLNGTAPTDPGETAPRETQEGELRIVEAGTP